MTAMKVISFIASCIGYGVLITTAFMVFVGFCSVVWIWALDVTGKGWTILKAWREVREAKRNGR